MKQAIPWNRLTAEAIVIVGSILLAFAIDAWWAERIERIDERAQLERLYTEFVTNIERIDIRTLEERAQEASTEVFELIEASQDNGYEEIEVPARTVRLILYAPTFDADTPILNGLISSGRLEIILNEEVLALISEWDRTFHDYTTWAERARRSVDERLIPALVARGDIGSVLMVQGPSVQAQFSQLDNIPVRIDDELKGFVAERWLNGQTALVTDSLMRVV